MLRAVLVRLLSGESQTLGHLHLYDGLDCTGAFTTLEPAWLHNQPDVSCIPTGRYRCSKRYSDKYGEHYRVTQRNGAEVAGRSMILIHHGNFRSDTRGCIVLGSAFGDINGDGLVDVVRSSAAMAALRACAGLGFNLDVL